MLGNSGGDPESGSSGGDGIAMAEADRSSGGGNRWPRQETMALIKIRTDMDVAFRDSSLKGPLWDDVSRKLSELGYHRNAKKCKEKFENVFKYHKRTKDGRATKSEGKTYRFFDQLEALDSQPSPPPHPPTHQAATQATPLSIAMPANNHIQATTQASPLSIAMPSIPNNNIFSSTQTVSQNPTPSPFNISFSTQAPATNRKPTPVASSSSASSDEEPEMRKNRKRKWEGFFERLTCEVMQRQEDMQKKFLEALEKCEKDRVAREEAWRAQELARTNREREILAQERAVANAKDAMIFAFLQKVSGTPQTPSDQQTVKPNETVLQNNTAPAPAPAPPPSEPVPPPQPPAIVPVPVQQKPISQAPTPVPQPSSHLQLQIQPPVQTQTMTKPKTDNGGEIVNFSPNPSSSRWPKAEIEALIKLRTNLDLKYQENVPKGPLWEEISAGMLRMGYNRNPKRCKEKWENINKYYKKMKESNKKRPEDSKTCPYFSQLEAIYKARETHFKQESMAAPIMARPEQQWPVQNRPELPLMEDHETDDDMDDDEDEENEGGNYEFVAAKPSSVGTAE